MWVGDKHLENMKALILDHFPIIPQKIHTYFQVFAAVHICRHHAIVGTVQQNFAEELDGLALCNVAIRLNERIIVFVEEEIEVCGKVSGNEIFMACQKLLDEHIRIGCIGAQ